VCVRISKPLSGTRRYCKPSEPFVVLVLLDVEALCSPADDRLDDDVRESVEASRGCTITLCWVQLRCDMVGTGSRSVEAEWADSEY
jgi:hypothetical protein